MCVCVCVYIYIYYIFFFFFFFLLLFYQEKKHIEIKNLFYKSVLAKTDSNTAHVGLTYIYIMIS